MVVVKPPEFEKIAIEPLSSTSSGLSPPSAPPMRTRFQRIRHAEAIGAEDVDAVRLAERADLARIVHRDFLGDDDDLLEIGIDADKLGDAVAHAGRRQIDNAGVEGETVVEAFTDIVVDRDVADRRRQHLAATAGRRPEHDIAAGKGVADRRDLARLAAENVEHANPVCARGDIGRASYAEIIGKPSMPRLEHESELLLRGVNLSAAALSSRAARDLRRGLPLFIQSSTFLA